ncbi:hypothetical protein A0256_15375 [Mucilaginibacter sp. PAMC 26640]|nr:hypothetical protein A0256_15375 [Mucilaginibacter sp. PAMC 26640]
MSVEVEANTFHAGICMAGAVSAGAYTAGVMDYLLEALENWERAKTLQAQGKLTGIPKHRFKIEVLGGASAGGMTAAITAAAVQSAFAPVYQADQNDSAKTDQNPLYNCWVNLKEQGDKDMMHHMLNTDDIENDINDNKSKEVRAGFNSSFIQEIASNMLDKRVEKEKVYQRPYFAADADVFTTITNLRGFNYKVTFETSTGPREHRMKMHRDYAFFRLGENGNNDGRIPVNFNAPNGLNTNILKQAAMATGAFPVGLESRDLERSTLDIEQNKYLNLMLTGKLDDTATVKYEFLPAEENFLTLNVDGGVINNEPYDITQNLLNDRQNISAAAVKTSAADFNSLVLMIDPFPNDDEPETSSYVTKRAWRNVLPSILSAMRGQLMMKDEQIKRAYLSDDYTRFLIMPVRYNDKGLSEKYTIACGSLGGFGGFFSKDFRKHDFFLGRRNCQQFLHRHFTVPLLANNPILTFGYDGINFDADADGKVYLPIVPDIRVTGNDTDGYKVVKPGEEAIIPYPKIKLSYLLNLKNPIEKRIQCILNNIQNIAESDAADNNSAQSWQSKIVPRIRKKSWFQKLINNAVTNNLMSLYLTIGKNAGKGSVADKCIDVIITDMEKRDLINDDLA